MGKLKLITHTRGPWRNVRPFPGGGGVINGGVERQYVNGSGRDQLFMVCGVQLDNGGPDASVGNATLATESVAMYLALSLLERRLARLDASCDGGETLREFVLADMRCAITDADDRWTLLITAIGWDRVYQLLEA